MADIEQKSKILGIDLGTTNSVMAILEGGNPTIVANSESGRTTSSVVAVSKSGEILIGQMAKRQNITNSKNTFYSIKRLMGNKYEDIDSKRFSYQIDKLENGKIAVYSPHLKKSFNPEEISALILKKLVTDANRYLNEKIEKAVITVPAYFNDSQRLATKDAGSIAGLDVLRILNEPTAAALAYGLGKKKNEIVLIFDLGGGTFDVSILEIGEDVFEVLATSGDTHLGGDDFDQAIVEYILSDFQKNKISDLRSDSQAMQRILEASEKAKIELSVLESTCINLPFICVENQEPSHIDLSINRAKFELLIKDTLFKCQLPINSALQDANLSCSDIEKVILVGGSTRIPAVRKMLIEFFGKIPNETVNPDEVVALGAAVQAGILSGEISNLILLDVTPLSLGVEISGGLMATIIKRNSSIPIEQIETFSTSTDNQEIVEIHVLQGEGQYAKENKSLGIFKLSKIPKASKGVPKISVLFNLDSDGLLSVSAREESSGISNDIKISNVIKTINEKK